jgi:hypothetical protein
MDAGDAELRLDLRFVFLHLPLGREQEAWAAEGACRRQVDP